MGDVASSSISHEQTPSYRVCTFQTLDAIFPKDSLFRLIYIDAAKAME